MARIPLWHLLKLFVVIWLQAPQTKGCLTVYRTYVLPLLKRHQKQIDAYLEEGRQRMTDHLNHTMRQAGFTGGWASVEGSGLLSVPATVQPAQNGSSAGLTATAVPAASPQRSSSNIGRTD